MIDLEKYLPKRGGLDLKKILVPPGKEVDLEKDFETGYTGAYKDKKEAEVDLAANVLRLADQQDLLFANDTYSLLIVFQALDAAGKDGTIKHVMSGVNPQGCDVHSFKTPSTEELNHDYLWRPTPTPPLPPHTPIF